MGGTVVILPVHGSSTSFTFNVRPAKPEQLMLLNVAFVRKQTAATVLKFGAPVAVAGNSVGLSHGPVAVPPPLPGDPAELPPAPPLELVPALPPACEPATPTEPPLPLPLPPLPLPALPLPAVPLLLPPLPPLLVLLPPTALPALPG